LFVHENFDLARDSLLTCSLYSVVETVEHYLETVKLNFRSSFSWLGTFSYWDTECTMDFCTV